MPHIGDVLNTKIVVLAGGLQACAAGHFGMPTEALPLSPGEGVEGSFSATMGVATGLTQSDGFTPVLDAAGFLRAPVSARDSIIVTLGGGNPQIHVAAGLLHTFDATQGPRPWHPWVGWTLGANSTLLMGAGASTAIAGGGTCDLSDKLGWTVEGSLELGYGRYGTGGIANASWLFGTGPAWRLRSAGPRQPFVMLRAGAALGHTLVTIDETGPFQGPRVMGVAPALQLVVGARPK
jgi:hypothetical protein